MSDDDVTLEMSMPLDSDGFLRRECPTCEREFKWYYTSEEQGDAAPIADGGYFCPYCGVQAESNTWLTQAQAELAHPTAIPRIPVGRVTSPPLVEDLRPIKVLISVDVYGRQRMRLDALDGSDGAHNPKVGGPSSYASEIRLVLPIFDFTTFATSRRRS